MTHFPLEKGWLWCCKAAVRVLLSVLIVSAVRRSVVLERLWFCSSFCFVWFVKLVIGGDIEAVYLVVVFTAASWYGLDSFQSTVIEWFWIRRQKLDLFWSHLWRWWLLEWVSTPNQGFLTVVIVFASDRDRVTALWRRVRRVVIFVES